MYGPTRKWAVRDFEGVMGKKGRKDGTSKTRSQQGNQAGAETAVAGAFAHALAPTNAGQPPPPLVLCNANYNVAERGPKEGVVKKQKERKIGG